MAQQFSNAARAKLAESVNADDTKLVLEEGYGALFPRADYGDWWYLTLQDDSGIEIVKVYRCDGDSLRVERGQDGTLARAFAEGTVVGLRLTAADARAWAATAERLAEPSRVDIYYDWNGNVIQTFATVNGGATRTTFYTYAGGNVIQTQTIFETDGVFQGPLRTVDYSFDSDGSCAGYTVTEVAQ